ncbi:hypothetical protein V1511DRAFT_502253 [Dipodascopsis uninucleata]
MVGFGDIMKNGWHPEKSGSSSSSSNNRSSSGGGLSLSKGLSKFTGSGSSNPAADTANTYRQPSKPITALTDPKLFPPPPKHREFHPEAGSAAISPEYDYLYEPARQNQQRVMQAQQTQSPNGYRSPYQSTALPPPSSYTPVPQNGVGQPAPAASPVSQFQQQPQHYTQPQYNSQPTYSPVPVSIPAPASTPYGQQPPLPTAARPPPPSLPPRFSPEATNSPAPAPPAYGQSQQQTYGTYSQPGTQPVYPTPTQHPQPQYSYQASSQPINSTTQPAAYQTPSYNRMSTVPSAYSPAPPATAPVSHSTQSWDSATTTTAPQPERPNYTGQQPNFAVQIAKARQGAPSTTPYQTNDNPQQRIPSGHRATQSMSVVGKKKPPPPPPKPKNPSLRDFGTPVNGQNIARVRASTMSAQSFSNQEIPKPALDIRPSALRTPSVTPKPPSLSRSNTPALAPKPQTTSDVPLPTSVLTTTSLTPPSTTTTTGVWTPPTVDLELDKMWYHSGTQPTKITQLPSFLSGLAYTYSVVISGDVKAITLSVRFKDLSRTKFRIECNRYDTQVPATAQRIDYPPPVNPDQRDLEAASTSFGEATARYAESMIGRQVGNGECWTLAHEALRNAGALESVGLIHGPQIWEYSPNSTLNSGSVKSIRRGDILQFATSRFRNMGPNGQILGEMFVGSPDHTAVVVRVDAVGNSGGELRVSVLEQNNGGVKMVNGSMYDFGNMVEGSVKAYRPFWKEWAGELETSWP